MRRNPTGAAGATVLGMRPGNRSYDETAVLQALLAAGHDLAGAEVADVAIEAAGEREGRIRVVLEWRLPDDEVTRVLDDSVRFEANACS